MGLIALAKRCLAAEPWQRPRHAGEVIAAVTAYQHAVAERLNQAELSRAAEQARAEEAQATAAQERKARRLTVGLAAAVLLLAIGGGAAGLWYQRDQAQRAAEATTRQLEEARKTALTQQGIRDALTQARKHQSGLHAQLQEQGGVFKLLNSPADWQRSIEDLPNAILAFKKALEFAGKFPQVTSLASSRLEKCNQLLLMDQRLPMVLQGEKTTLSEQLALADFCAHYRQRYRDGVQLYAAIFAAQPKLAEDLKKGLRFQAATAAALAAVGQGADADKLDDKERNRLRKQAIAWFQAEFTLTKQTLKDGTPTDKLLIHERLAQAQANPDLATGRSAKLPDAETPGLAKTVGRPGPIAPSSAGDIHGNLTQGNPHRQWTRGSPRTENDRRQDLHHRHDQQGLRHVPPPGRQ